jgi:ribosome-associated protein
MDIRKLQRAIVDGLEDVKAQDIAVFNTEHLSPLFERVIVASGNSNRQTKALAASVRDAVKSSGFPVMRTEGEDNGEWIIVDCGAAVAHIMQPAIRQYYHLEEIWGGKPVKMKLGDGKAGGLVKASEPMDADDEAEAVPKAVAKKAPARKAAAAKKPAAKVAAGKGAAAKAPARKPASGKAAAKPVAKPAAKKAPAKKPATKKVVTTKTVVVKPGRPGTAAAKKPVAKKAAPTRKTSR